MCVCTYVRACLRACVRVCVYIKIQPSVLQRPLTVDLYMSCNLIYILILMKRFYEMSLLGEPLVGFLTCLVRDSLTIILHDFKHSAERK